ncbi:hypothetical protein [Actinoplanes sp. NPDC026670]|uniref:hypothetical protein n=1 Tax=Actinoplanes sp. NPDC026670 TaxID=3154700 RepID=UPI0033FC2ADD
MPGTTRPLLAVRLIGPTDTVTTQKAYLTAYLSELFGDQAAVRASTHSARRAGEIRAYLTVAPKETHDSTDTNRDDVGDRSGR